MDSNYLKELEEEIQKRKAESELQFKQAKIGYQKNEIENPNLENSNHQSDIEQENNLEQEQEEIEQSPEKNIEEEDEDNDIVNEGIKSLADENKIENNNINFDLKEEKNLENINYEIQDLNEPKNDLNYPNLISMNQSGICQCCNKEFDDKNNLPCLLKCNHIFCKICLETYFTEAEGIKCPIDGLVGKDINDVKIVNTLIEKKEIVDNKNKKKKKSNKNANKKKKDIKKELDLDINDNLNNKNIEEKNLNYLEYKMYNNINDMNNNINDENENNNEHLNYREDYDENNENENISNTNNENEENYNENKIKDFNEIQFKYSDKLPNSKPTSKKTYSNNKKTNKKESNKSNASNQNINISNLNNNNMNENDQDNNDNIEDSPEQEEYNQNFCNIHPEQKITHFVEDTKELICIHCAFNKLKNNPTIQIKEISEKCKEYLNDLDTIIDNNQKYSQLIQNSLNDINENKENEEKKIIEIYEQLLNLLVTNRNNFLIKIEEIYQENTGNMNKKLENFAEIIDIAEKLKEDFEAIAEQAPYEFNHLTQAFNKFIRDMNDKSKSDLDIIQYNFSHDELNKVLKYLNNFSDVKTRKKCYRFDFLKNNGSQNYSIREINTNQNNNNFNDNYINRNINDNNVFNNGINRYYKASKELKYINFSNTNNNNFIQNNKMNNNNFNNNVQKNMNVKNDSLLEGSNNNLRFNFKYEDKGKNNNRMNLNGNSVSDSFNNTLNKYIIPNNNFIMNDSTNKNSLRNFQNSGNMGISNNSELQNFKDSDKLAILNKYKIPNKAKQKNN